MGKIILRKKQLTQQIRKILKMEYSKNPKPIRILTYNICCMPFLFSNHMTWMQDYQKERLEEFAENHFKNYDIICLQEVFSGIIDNRPKVAVELAKKHGLIYSSVAPIPFFWNFIPPYVNGGHMILSRFPIVETEYNSFLNVKGWDGQTDMGTLYSKIEIDSINKKTQHLFNTHLQADNYPFLKNKVHNDAEKKDALNSTQIRLTNMCDLRKFMEKKYAENSIKSDDSNNMVVVCGDFNVNSNAPELPIDYFFNNNPIYQKYNQTLKITQENLQKNKKSIEKLSEYDICMEIISGNRTDKVIDLALEGLGKRPVTFGETLNDDQGNKMPCETFLTLQEDQMTDQSLDYCLVIQKDKGKDQKNLTKPFDTVCKSIKVNKFISETKHYEKISDHYGLEFCLEM